MKNTKITVFTDLFQSKSVPFILTLEEVVKRIRSGKSKDKVNNAKAQTTEEGYQTAKNKLPAILFAGEFTQRNKKSCKKHSGLMVTDYDKIFTQEEFDRIWSTLKNNKHTVLLFESPSCDSGVESLRGKGIKCVVRIPECDAINHERYFKQFNKDFDYDYWDKSNCDISRTCFESYDPNMYVNYNAECYSPKLTDEGFTVSEKVPLIPIKEEMRIIDRIMLWNWSRNYAPGERNNYIFDLAGAFCEYGVSESSAEGYIINHVVNDDMKMSEVKTTIKSAYKRRSFDTKYFEDYEKLKEVKTNLSKGKAFIKEHFDIDENTINEIKETVEHEDFWFYEEDSKGNQKVKIDGIKYKLFLENNGFKKYFPNGSSNSTWVKIQSNKVSETSTEKIKDFVLNYLMDNKKFDVWNKCHAYQNLFSEHYLSMLDAIDLLMLQDEKDKSYIAFCNGILEVTKDNIKLIDYIDVKGYIWESHIINRDFELLDDYNNDYQKFVYNISNQDSEKLESVIGYLMHTYKNKINNKAIILNDEVITDNPEGGTGKGVFIQGIKQIRKVSILDGKTFDDKKSFAYQTVTPETNVLVFDDVKKNFDFESKFSIVTEGMTLERKNKDAIKLTVEESPKMVISTNYAIKGEGNSHDRRRHEIEVAQYYGKENTPFDDFGRQLFDDWSEEDYIKFDNYMIRCLQLYLNKGLIKQDGKNNKLRKFIAETSMDFNEWTEEFKIPINKRLTKDDYFNSFTNEYTDYKKHLTKKRFNIWIKKYAKYKRLEYDDGVSNGNRWFSISDGSEVHDEVPF